MLDEQDVELLAEWLASDAPHQTPLGRAIHRALVGYLVSLRYSVADGASDPNALAVLARDPCPCARYRVARNPATPAEVLEGLAADRDPSVRETVARHPSCPAHVRTMLQADAHEDVRAAAQGKTPRHVALHDARMAQQARERLGGMLQKGARAMGPTWNMSQEEIEAVGVLKVARAHYRGSVAIGVGGTLFEELVKLELRGAPELDPLWNDLQHARYSHWRTLRNAVKRAASDQARVLAALRDAPDHAFESFNSLQAAAGMKRDRLRAAVNGLVLAGRVKEDAPGHRGARRITLAVGEG